MACSSLDDITSQLRESMKITDKASAADPPNIDELSSIERLPTDLWWTILAFVPESVLNLRLTSSIVRGRVDQYALDDRHQLVHRLSLRTLPNKEGVIEVAMIVTKPVSGLFQLSLQLRQGPLNVVRRIQRTFPEREVDLTTYTVDIDSSIDDEAVQYLKACLGRRIRTCVSMRHLEIWREFDVISNLLDGISFDALRIESQTLSEEAAEHMLETIKAHRIEHLSLEVLGVAVADPVKLLLDLSSLVQSLTIRQLSGVEPLGAHYLFGAYDRDWVPIFLEMFTKKLDNRWYQNYLSLEDAETLKERLPLTGKRLWCSVACNKFETGFKHTNGDYLVQGDHSRFHA